MPLGNFATKYTKLLDATLQNNPATTDLNMNQDLVGEMTGAGKIEIAKIALQGLADYDRSSGFVEGDITTSWEEVQLAFDRGRQFSIDNMDNEERLEIVTANAMGSFVNDSVIPEVDAIRFSRMAEKSGNTKAETLTTAADALKAVLAGETVMEDQGINLSECLFYVTGSTKALLREGSAYRFARTDNPSTNFTTFDDMKSIVPKKETFVTAIETLDGKTSGEVAGGFKKATSGADINFMIVHPSAVAAITKHNPLRYFSPDVNQEKDAHKWQYRLYHDLFVYANKVGLIYTSYVG